MLRAFGGLHRDLDELFEGVFGSSEVATADWTPRVDTYLKDDALHVRTDLPGVDPGHHRSGKPTVRT
jgi:HSP20 family molecular chaperone IbpA